MTSGGFDPVAVEAEAGDTLSVTVVHETGDDTTAYSLVPVRSRPRVVRTSPQRGTTDVPLNSLIIVVFSEPMDSASLPDALHLRQDGADVPGTVIWELKDGVILSGRFVPTTPLAPLSTYELSVSTAAKSPYGAPLDAGLTVEFTTVTATAPPIDPTGPTGVARRVAYVWQNTVLVSNLDGSAPVALADEASQPAWSPDGARIAFTRPTDGNLAHWQLCVARADGSDARCVVGDRDGSIRGRPSWSPDGGRIAFTIFVYSCPNGYCGQLGGFFTSLLVLNTATMVVDTVTTPPLTSVSWSPDGSKIAFTEWGAGHVRPGCSGNRQPGRLGSRDSRAIAGLVFRQGGSLVTRRAPARARSAGRERLSLVLRYRDRCRGSRCHATESACHRPDPQRQLRLRARVVTGRSQHSLHDRRVGLRLVRHRVPRVRHSRCQG